MLSLPFLIDLGEITRNLLLHLIDLSVLFNGHSSDQLNTHYGLDTALVSGVENATTSQQVIDILVADLGLPKDVITEQDVDIVKWACRIVATRAAYLAACAVASVIRHTRNDVEPGKDVPGQSGVIDVGLDGS